MLATTTSSSLAMAPELKSLYQVIDEAKDSPNEFKFDLDTIWRPLGYARKDHGVRAVKKLAEGEDFRSSPSVGRLGSKSRSKRGRGGHNKKTYLLSSNGLEKLATACGTEIGHQVRKYLISLRHAARDGDLKLAEEVVANRSRIANTDVLVGAANVASDVQTTRVAERVSVTSCQTLGPSQNFLLQKRKLEVFICIFVCVNT